MRACIFSISSLDGVIEIRISLETPDLSDVCFSISNRVGLSYFNHSETSPTVEMVVFVEKNEIC